jgi:hypothetical protein
MAPSPPPLRPSPPPSGARRDSQLLTFRGDSIIRIESIVDRARALAMAGLGE